MNLLENTDLLMHDKPISFYKSIPGHFSPRAVLSNYNAPLNYSQCNINLVNTGHLELSEVTNDGENK